MSDWLTIEELAKREGIEKETARKRAQRGQYDRMKDGNRTLYRILTGEGEASEEDGEGEGEGDGMGEESAAEKPPKSSTNSDYYAARARKMAAEAERAEIKLNRDRLILYDEIRGDCLSIIHAFTANVREGLDQIGLDNATASKLDRFFEEAYKKALDHAQELREGRQGSEFEADLKAGYYDFSKRKDEEEEAAKLARKKAEEEERKRREASLTLEDFRLKRLGEFRNHSRNLFTAKPREHQEANAWQTAELDLERGLILEMEKTQSREEIEKIRTRYIKRLEEKAAEILTPTEEDQPTESPKRSTASRRKGGNRRPHRNG